MDDLSYSFLMAEWRIERANSHMEHLQKIVDWIVSPEQFVLLPGKNESTGHHTFSVGPKSGGLPHHLPIVVGEVLHNLAVALDYCWSGITRSVDPSEVDRVYFPIRKSLDGLNIEIEKATAVKKHPVLASILREELQPFRDGNKMLWAIREMHNIDKHRLLLAALTIARFGKFVLTSEDGSIIDLSHSIQNSDGPKFKMAFAAPFTLNSDAEVFVNVALNEPGIIPPGSLVMETCAAMIAATSHAVTRLKTALN